MFLRAGAMIAPQIRRNGTVHNPSLTSQRHRFATTHAAAHQAARGVVRRSIARKKTETVEKWRNPTGRPVALMRISEVKICHQGTIQAAEREREQEVHETI